MELLLASERGNAGFAVADSDAAPRLILEVVFVLEAVAPARLHVDRFLPPTPVRVVVDQNGTDLTDDDSFPDSAELDEGRARWLQSRGATLRPLLAKMFTNAEQVASAGAARLRDTAVAELRDALGAELARLRVLAEINSHVRAEELDDISEELTAVERHVAQARLRMDSARLIWQGPSVDGEPRPTAASQ
jgi:ATP-dependent helicase HepA